MKYGLSDEQWQSILINLSQFSQVEKAVLFGSRALGTYKATSDIDIAIFGTDANFWLAAHIKNELEEKTVLPYFFDIISYNTIDNEALKEHIQQYGEIIYQKSFRSQD